MKKFQRSGFLEILIVENEKEISFFLSDLKIRPVHSEFLLKIRGVKGLNLTKTSLEREKEKSARRSHKVLCRPNYRGISKRFPRIVSLPL